jgi:UDP-glucose 4-epimerase
MKKVLVAGGTGFIGLALSRHLAEFGFQVHRVGRTFIGDEPAGTIFHSSDLTSRDATLSLVRTLSPDFVINLAATKVRTHSQPDHKYRNFSIAENLMVACEKTNTTKAFVHFGSCEEYGPIEAPFQESMICRPSSEYGRGKLMVAEHVSAHSTKVGFETTIVRPSVVYGPKQENDMFIPALAESLWRGEEFRMSAGHQLRDFIYIDDLVRAILLLLDQVNGRPKILNLASGTSVPIRDLALEMVNVFNSDPQLLKFGTEELRVGEIMDYRVSSKLAEEVLGWKPEYNLADGILRVKEALASSKREET